MFVYFAAVRWGSKKDLALPLMRDMGGYALFSYGYKKETEECMFIYFAHAGADKTDKGKSIRTLLPEVGIPHGLGSFAYLNDCQIEHWAEMIKIAKAPRILIDSGAFTAYTTGKVINVKEYGKWALEFKRQWQHLMHSLEFFNLDVIGDEDASDKNLGILESMGLKPLPIFTYKGDIKYLEKYINNYDYLALGGLVGKTTKEQVAWLDYCFKYVIAHYKKTGEMPRTHLLGVTKQSLLERYPCYSSDSSSWVGCLRFGGGDAIGKKKIPRYKDSPEALRVTIATLRAEIKKYKKMQNDVTELWKKRGIRWDE
jgi:hypothetical protein